MGQEAMALGYDWQIGGLATLQQPSFGHGTPQDNQAGEKALAGI
jgi:hypothetical protein